MTESDHIALQVGRSERTVEQVHIRKAYSGGLNLDQNLAGPRLRNSNFINPEFSNVG